jgi:hypothetical protein
MPSLRDAAHDGVLFTFSTRCSSCLFASVLGHLSSLRTHWPSLALHYHYNKATYHELMPIVLGFQGNQTTEKFVRLCTVLFVNKQVPAPTIVHKVYNACITTCQLLARILSHSARNTKPLRKNRPVNSIRNSPKINCNANF